MMLITHLRIVSIRAVTSTCEMTHISYRDHWKKEDYTTFQFVNLPTVEHAMNRKVNTFVNRHQHIYFHFIFILSTTVSTKPT